MIETGNLVFTMNSIKSCTRYLDTVETFDANMKVRYERKQDHLSLFLQLRQIQ